MDFAAALSLADALVASTGSDNIRLQFSNIENNYRIILDYLTRGTRDEQRANLYARVGREILDLADRLLLHFIASDAANPVSILQRSWSIDPSSQARHLEEYMSQMLAHHRLSDHLPEELQEDEVSGAIVRDRFLGQLFSFCWLSPVIEDDMADAFRRVLQPGALPEEEQSLIISGINLGLSHNFNRVRIHILLETIAHPSAMVRARALTGIIQTIHRYHKRFRFYPELASSLETWLNEVLRKEELEIILLQLIRSQDTDAITKRLREEIIPEMIKIGPRITEKLDAEEFSIEDLGSEENPQWERFLGDNPELMDKIQQLNDLQMDGSDVFMSAFAMLKHFPFFREVHHWFLPFSKENSIVQNEIHRYSKKMDTQKLVDGLSSTGFLCNSDKFSFLFNLDNLQEQQLNMLDHYFSAEMDMMRELQDEERLLDDLSRFRTEARMYIQDLYRFHRLHSLRSAVPDIFKAFLGLHRTALLGPYLQDSGLLRTMAEFHFSRGHYEQAAGMFAQLADAGETSYEVFEKAGFAYQKMGHFEQALTYYGKAELYDTNQQWLLRKMAYCQRRLGKPEEAIPMYRQALKIEGDEEKLMMQLANTLLEAGKFREALNQYLGIELKYPENTRVIRPLAWCLLNTGQAEKAREYLMNLGEAQWNRHDLLNIGHSHWIDGDAARAYEYYRSCLKLAGVKPEDIIDAFTEDIPLLRKQGIEEADIYMMRDALKQAIANS